MVCPSPEKLSASVPQICVCVLDKIQEARETNNPYMCDSLSSPVDALSIPRTCVVRFSIEYVSGGVSIFCTNYRTPSRKVCSRSHAACALRDSLHILVKLMC